MFELSISDGDPEGSLLVGGPILLHVESNQSGIQNPIILPPWIYLSVAA